MPAEMVPMPRISRPCSSGERCTMRPLMRPRAEEAGEGGAYGDADGGAAGHEEMGDQWYGRSGDEGQPHHEGVLDRVGGVLGADAQFLLHQGPQPQVVVLGYIVGHLPRLPVGAPLPLEKHHQLGQLLGRVGIDLAGLALYLGTPHVALGAGAEEGAGGHGDHARQGAGEASDDDEGLTLNGDGQAGDQGHGAEQAVLGAENHLAETAEAGHAPSLPLDLGGGSVVGVAVEGTLGGCRCL